MLVIDGALASQSQPGYAIGLSYDGQTSTFWHSPWGSTTTSFPVTLTYRFAEPQHVDYIRYTPRQDGNSNGNWRQITVKASRSQSLTANNGYTDLLTTDLQGSSSTSEILLGADGVDSVRTLRIVIQSGQANFASAAEVAFFRRDNTRRDAFMQYFADPLCTQLKPEITSTDAIADPDAKALADNLLADPVAYKRFRVGEYEAYRTTQSVRDELWTSAQYCNYENPTGVYARAGRPMIVLVDGITDYPVKLTVKNFVQNESRSDYALRNGFNYIEPTTTGNTFVNYYTDQFAQAPRVRVHFVNGEQQGYFDQQTMTNADWAYIMSLHPSATDSTIIICRSEHAQTAYPAYCYRQFCPTDIDSLMTLYEQVQWAERDMMGLKMYGREVKNRQMFIGTTYGFMAAGGEFAFCNVGSLGAIMRPNAAQFDFWGVGHEWGHNNQIQPGFKWSGCGETTNNIYASWAQLNFNGGRYLRLEDEVTGVNDYSGMRGGRMQTYFEEGLRKGVCWQMQDGPDYHGATPDAAHNSRNYDHFVKLVPFWQLNLWGIKAERSPYIIAKVIEGLRRSNRATVQAMSNGKQQLNWMRMACDSAGLDLTTFFERAGMLRPINQWIEDYGAGQNTITKADCDALKKHCQDKGYPAPTDEVNYITGYNYPIYRDRLPLEVPTTMGQGCTLSGSTVRVEHSKVKNAVAYETYNADDQLVRITMYALGSDDSHSYTRVLYPGGEDAAYIMAVGYDGTRRRIFEYNVPKLPRGQFYTLKSVAKGGYLTAKNITRAADGTLTQNVARQTSLDTKDAGALWLAEERDGQMYLYNPQADLYLGGTAGQSFAEYTAPASAPTFVASAVDAAADTWTLALNGGGQYLNAYSATNTGFWSGGANDPNNIWEVKAVGSLTVTVPSTGYRALCYPFTLTLPEGFTAYAATELLPVADTTFVVLHALDGTIPALTPAILYRGESGSAQCAIAPAAAPAAAALLVGNTLKETGHEAGSLLSLQRAADGRIGFCLSQTTTKTANYAYLPATRTEATQTVLVLDSEITAVASLRADLREGYFDLQGRRVIHPQRGRVYVTRGGRKVILQ